MNDTIFAIDIANMNIQIEVDRNTVVDRVVWCFTARMIDPATGKGGHPVNLHGLHVFVDNEHKPVVDVINAAILEHLFGGGS